MNWILLWWEEFRFSFQEMTGIFRIDFRGNSPKHGYTEIFEKMLSHPNIKIKLNTDFRDEIEIDFQKGKIFFQEEEFAGKIIYTGELDELFNYRFGWLPYRSLKFVFKTIEKEFFSRSCCHQLSQ